MRDYGDEDDYAERESFVQQLDSVTVVLLGLAAVFLLLTVVSQIGMAIGRWMA